MSSRESATYLVAITLIADEGELPTPKAVEELIADQMSGELDNDIGLFCGAVDLIDNTEELDAYLNEGR